MTTYKKSAGKAIPIAEMNPYHLDAAIKKLTAQPDPSAARQALLAALRAEQTKRGGPPNRGGLPGEES